MEPFVVWAALRQRFHSYVLPTPQRPLMQRTSGSSVERNLRISFSMTSIGTESPSLNVAMRAISCTEGEHPALHALIVRVAAHCPIVHVVAGPICGCAPVGAGQQFWEVG